MSNAFDELLCDHAGLSMEKQLNLSDLTADAGQWSADLKAGTLTLGNHTWRCQLLGSHAENDDTWLWGWANPYNYGPHILQAALHLRELGQQQGIFELTERKFVAGETNGYVIAMVASGLCNASAFYRMPYQGGAGFVLIDDPAYPVAADSGASRMAEVFTTLIQNVTISNQRRALESYARQRGLGVQGDAQLLEITFPATGESLKARFDDARRLIQIDFQVG